MVGCYLQPTLYWERTDKALYYFLGTSNGSSSKFNAGEVVVKLVPMMLLKLLLLLKTEERPCSV